MDLFDYIRDLFAAQDSDASSLWPDDSLSRGLWDTTSTYYSACHPSMDDSIGCGSITTTDSSSPFTSIGLGSSLFDD